MKEATGELSMTAVVVVIIGILAVALPIIIRQVTNTMQRNANCAAAFGCDRSTCDGTTGTMKCYYVPEGSAAADPAADPSTGGSASSTNDAQEIWCGCTN